MRGRRNNGDEDLGTTLSYTRYGRGQKDVVFLHGWGGSKKSFAALSDALSSSYNVTLLDFYGFGDTAASEKPLFVRDYADAVIEILDKENIEKATFVGHSFGGRVALVLGSEYKERVDKLVLIDAAGVPPRRGLRYKIRVFLHKFLVKLGFKGLKGSSDYAALTDTERQTFKNIVNEDLTPCLPKISAPTLILWGKDDKDTPLYMAEILKENIANSGLTVLEGGHFAYLSSHHTVLNALKYFLRT